ncbi:uncharacterized protein J8A68_002795 [[Candida] subhashii]|uniref:BRO1 domain-containing protein n=1 Tax=[Candida] subhashii TaxID=561895 RepID=A0A8J5V006_9ASCO|nr:uncharacterized protein J8A68_002795 [[Candida] subhashii]KAG7663679.1 hypothetical protein J8A68_002795 [[Candida] subhashii]
MKTHLLVVPSKETEELNWIKPLNNYLLSLYGNTSNYQTELSNFNKLRQDIRGVNADNTGLRLYYTYYSQVELLDLRIPWSKIRKVEFEWFEAFGTGPSHKQKSLAFEKASILFNIASLLSKFAKSKYDESSQDDKAEQGTKMTIQLFQTVSL